MAKQHDALGTIATDSLSAVVGGHATSHPTKTATRSKTVDWSAVAREAGKAGLKCAPYGAAVGARIGFSAGAAGLGFGAIPGTIGGAALGGGITAAGCGLGAAILEYQDQMME